MVCQQKLSVTNVKRLMLKSKLNFDVSESSLKSSEKLIYCEIFFAKKSIKWKNFFLKNIFVCLDLKSNKNREFKMSNSKNSVVRVITGLILVVVGILYLMKNFGLIEINILSHLLSFRSLLIFVGLITVFNSSKKVFGYILIAFGLVWHYAVITGTIDFGKLVLPLILLGLGAYLIFRQRKTEKKDDGATSSNYGPDAIEDISIFGGGNKTVFSQNFKGGSVTAVFGGSEIDFTKCELAVGENVLDVLAVFGGYTLMIPSHWNVIVDVLPIFGGFSNKIHKHDKEVIDTSKTLIIKGLVIFGGGELKRY